MFFTDADSGETADISKTLADRKLRKSYVNRFCKVQHWRMNYCFVHTDTKTSLQYANRAQLYVLYRT